MTYLLDTNVVSELLRAKPDERVEAWVRTRSAADLAISAITAAEMLYGVRQMPAGRRRQTVEQAVAAALEQAFSGRILAFDARCAAAYADVMSLRRAMGRPVQIPDAQIAAIARRDGLVLVTRNVRDFDELGLTVVDPWAAEAA